MAIARIWPACGLRGALDHILAAAGNGPAAGSITSGPPPLMTVIERRAAGSVAIPTDCGPPWSLVAFSA